MKYALSALLVVSALLPVTSYSKSGEYLCIVDQAVGFDLNKDSTWSPISINGNVASGLKYVLHKLKKDDPVEKNSVYTHGVWLMGHKDTKYYCSYSNQYNSFICPSGVGVFKYSLDTGRFIATVTMNYWRGDNTNGFGEPYLAIGKCSEL